ncbi:MAG: hypothetical protein GY863_24395 [bacterium]|nr:hypothetical protein [bacterium]
MKTIYSILILISFSLNSYAQSPVQALINTHYKDAPEDINVLNTSEFRQVIDLNGEWKVRLGSSDVTNDILVPSSIEYKGRMYFSRSFYLPPDMADYNTKLFALAINNSCTIKINDVFVGSHSGGYTSFSIDILDAVLKPGESNLIEIEIDNTILTNSPVFFRPQPWGWKSYGGIIREIFLTLQPKATLTNWSMEYSFRNDYSDTDAVFTFNFQNYYRSSGEDEGSENSLRREDIQEIGYYIEIFNKKTNNLIKSTAADPKFLNVHQAVEDTLMLNFRNVELWSPDDPVNYNLIITLIKRGNIVVDRFSTNFGFKEVIMRPDGLYLNGVKTKLIGVYRVEQHPDFGVSLPYNIQRQDLIQIKNLGINAVRTGPYPNHPYFYDLCDEIGILVLEEIPINRIPNTYIARSDFIEQASQFVSEMISRDKHHPSIIGWGIGSELNSGSPETRQYLDNIAETARRLDSRPLYYSTMIDNFENTTDNIDFVLRDYFSPDLNDYDSIMGELRSAGQNKPVLIGRIGPDVFPDNLRGYQNKTSIAYQSKYFGDLYNLINDDDTVPGVFFWSFADWKGDTPTIIAGPDHAVDTFYRGLVDENRVERQAYQYLQATIGNSRLASLTIGSEVEVSQKILVFSGFGLILIMIIALKKHRWFGKNFKRSIFFTKNFFQDVLDNRNIQIWQTLLLTFAISASFAIGISGVCFFYKRDVFFDLLISQFILSYGLKKFIVILVWNPVYNIMFLTIVIFIVILINAFIYNIFLLFFGVSRGSAFSLNTLVWSGSHFVFGIPFSMAVYSSLGHVNTIIFYAIAGSIFFALYFWRLLLALKVAFKRGFNKALICLVLLALLFWGGIAFYFQSKYDSFTYAENIINNIEFQE